jgi:hypothetical protein
MASLLPTEVPVAGKTFSLFADSATSDGYFQAVAGLADRCLRLVPDRSALIDLLRSLSGNRRRLRRLADHPTEELPCRILREASAALSPFTVPVNAHLATLSLRARWDRTISMTREQYHLAMLEIELMNRQSEQTFRTTSRRIAFLPHCIKDRSRSCRSEVEGIDYVCRGCAKECWLNAASNTLRIHGVVPYIWMEADLSSILRNGSRRGERLGVFGVACVPELLRGMRRCQRHGIPVLGVPLNANRCARWMGEFFPNSVNLGQIAMLARGNDPTDLS